MNRVGEGGIGRKNAHLRLCNGVVGFGEGESAQSAISECVVGGKAQGLGIDGQGSTGGPTTRAHRMQR